MASVLHKLTKQYIPSVNTPDYMDGNWIINPDMTLVSGQPQKYWIIENSSLRVASDEEKLLIDKTDRFADLSIQDIKDKLNTNINVFRDAYITEGVILQGHLFDSDARARENIMGMCNAITLGVQIPQGFTWRSRHNEDVPMNAQMLAQFGIGTLTFVSGCFSASWVHKDFINAMTSLNVLDYVNYDFTVGWPARSLDGTTLATS